MALINRERKVFDSIEWHIISIAIIPLEVTKHYVSVYIFLTSTFLASSVWLSRTKFRFLLHYSEPVVLHVAY